MVYLILNTLFLLNSLFFPYTILILYPLPYPLNKEGV